MTTIHFITSSYTGYGSHIHMTINLESIQVTLKIITEIVKRNEKCNSQCYFLNLLSVLSVKHDIQYVFKKDNLQAHCKLMVS